MRIIYRSLSFAFFLLTFVPFAIAQDTAGTSEPHLFAKPFATIQYKISKASKGEETLYFDHWGMRQATYRKEESARLGTGNTIHLRLGINLLKIDPDKNLGQKKIDEPLKQLLADFNPAQNKIYAIELLVQSGATKVGTETILSRPCDIWQNQKAGIKVWVWEGITLKSEIHSLEGEIVTVAVSIDETTPIEERVFNAAEGVHFVDMDINQILLSQL